MKNNVIEKQFLDEFERYSNQLNSTRLRIISLAGGVALYLLYNVLDWIVIPQHAFFFFKMRVALSVQSLVVFYLAKEYKKYVNLLIPCLFIPAALYIAVMIRFYGGGDSPYYAGLSLVITAYAVSIISPLKRAIPVYLTIVAMYNVPVLLLDNMTKQMVQNNMFLLSTCAVGLLFNYISYKMVYRDFRQHRMLQLNTTRFRDSFNGIDEGIIIFSERKDIVYMNSRVKDLLGFEKEIALPEGYIRFIEHNLWRDVPEANKENEVFNIEKELQLKENVDITLLLKLRKVILQTDYGMQVNYVLMMRDVSYQKRVEQIRADFVSDINHELRSALTPVREAVSLIHEEKAGEINERQKRFLNMVLKNVDRLIRLISTLLDLSKIEANRMELDPKKSDIAQALRNVWFSFRATADHKGVIFEEPDCESELPKFIFDDDRIIQVLTNLLGNAFKYTPRGNKIKIGCKWSSGKKDGVLVYVSDEGTGIPDNVRSSIFEKYRQVKVEDGLKGTGLGLAISKHIVELHNGRIWFNTEKGKGTTFYFILPLKLDN